ncbi:VWA domain-containing protein [Methylococcus geothermalis]|uniref:VWA domain-containing protein n=1 Tax=Methylococcus geothermalis TaxID=2681310 RepID=A0A858Q7M6_9GAMM|nr:VWA domain-containing protein [Methylococcus geothermalis]QJD29858.1 VWA domain-containing protein [Methylococcus geothermalis]
MSRLRICRSPATAYPPPQTGLPDAGLHARLCEAMRRHLSPAAATLLAEPAPSGDGEWIDWYTTLAGQPVPLRSLAADGLRRARNLLEDRIQAMLALSERLAPGDPGLAEAMRRAAGFPDESAVYVVDGQPVLTFWGYGETTRPGSARFQAAPASRKHARWPWLAWAGLLLSAGLGWAAFHLDLWRWPPWGPDYAALLAAERQAGDDLWRTLLERQSELARSLGQCALQAQRDAVAQEGALLAGRLDALTAELARKLETCRDEAALEAASKEHDALSVRLSGLRSELAAKREKCGNGKLSAERAESARLRTKLTALKAKLAAQLSRCGKKPPIETAETTSPPAVSPVPGASPQPVKPAEGLPPCPGERPPEDAPDVAIVLDASGSMRIPSVLDGNSAQLIARFERCMMDSGLLAPVVCADLIGAYESITQAGRGPTRLMAAQRAVNNVVSGLPGDVDVGLVVLEDCPQASDYGMYDSARRGQLLQRVNGLIPRKGTPLGNGIVQAANKVDGVRAPAVMVVVSDGKDSCNANPCSIAAAVKAAKPKLKINVVDIVGDGAVSCIAQATGGDVLTPKSGMSLDQMVRQAAKDAEKPAHCK